MTSEKVYAYRNETGLPQDRLSKIMLAADQVIVQTVLPFIDAAWRDAVIAVRDTIERNDAVDSLAEGGWMQRRVVLKSLDEVLNEEDDHV